MAFCFPNRVYPIADADAASAHGALGIVTAALTAGCRLVQLRMKRAATRTFVDVARAAKALTDRHAAALIINDRTDIAQLIDAAGVHLGQDDLPLDRARALLGPHRIIGTSTHSLVQLDAVVGSGIPDYVAYGPIFSTVSKERPDPVQGLAALRAARAVTTLPLVAIGGIDVDTVAAVFHAGADAVAVIAAVCGAEDPLAATRALLATAGRARLPPSHP